MKLSRREAVMVAACVLVVAFIGVPSLREIQRMGGHGRTAADLSADAARARTRGAALEKEIAGLDQEVRALTWPDAPSRLPSRILVELDGLAAKAGVTMGTLRPGRAAAAPCGSKLPFLVQIRAPFPRVAAFLRALKASQPRVALERLQVVATDANTNEVSLELRLAVFSSRPPEK